MLSLVWRILSLLGAGAAYRIVHGMPARLQGLAAKLFSSECPSHLDYRVEELGSFANPVGLAAGLNKDGNLTFLGDVLCLGFTVVGSILPYRWRGASRKLLVRLTEESAVNRLGLPSRGIEYVDSALASYRPTYTRVAINVAGLRRADYVRVAEALGSRGAFIEVNVSCPNTEEHGTFENPEYAVEIVRSVARVAERPVLLKIPNTIDRDVLEAYASIVSETGIQGIVAGNTSKIWIRGVQAGLSGGAIYWKTLRIVRTLRDLLPGRKVIIAVGGITRPERAVSLLEEGAELVEILSALLRLGPSRVREIVWAAWKWASRT